jgi:uncharacterized membrane protein YtjA (UPF0391 family)
LVVGALGFSGSTYQGGRRRCFIALVAGAPGFSGTASSGVVVDVLH